MTIRDTQIEKRKPWQILERGSEIANRYQIEKLLGEGGMGAVFLAYDKLLSTEGSPNKVAIKVVRRDVGEDEEYRKRFLQEIQLTRSVTHPNVVRTFEVGVHEGNLFLTMEHIDGSPLSALYTGNPLDSVVAANVIAEIAAGLRAIHEAKIIHRDLKPQNILVSRKGEVKIADFGIAKPSLSEAEQGHELIGSAFYMSPEAWQGEELSPATDVYSLGVLAYEIATGVLPFDGLSSAEIMAKHLDREVVDPLVIFPGVPAWLSELIVAMLAKRPEDRPSPTRIIALVESNLKSSQRRSKIPASDFQLRPAGVFADDTASADDSPTESGGWQQVKDALDTVERQAKKRRWSVLGYQGTRKKLLDLEDPKEVSRRLAQARVATVGVAIGAVLWVALLLVAFTYGSEIVHAAWLDRVLAAPVWFWGSSGIAAAVILAFGSSLWLVPSLPLLGPSLTLGDLFIGGMKRLATVGLLVMLAIGYQQRVHLLLDAPPLMQRQELGLSFERSARTMLRIFTIAGGESAGVRNVAGTKGATLPLAARIQQQDPVYWGGLLLCVWGSLAAYIRQLTRRGRLSTRGIGGCGLGVLGILVLSAVNSGLLPIPAVGLLAQPAGVVGITLGELASVFALVCCGVVLATITTLRRIRAKEPKVAQ